MSCFLSRLNLHARVIRRHRTCPLSRPADRHHHALARSFDIEERERVRIGRSAAQRRKSDRLIRLHLFVNGREVRPRCVTAKSAVQDKLALFLKIQRCIQRLNFLNNGCILIAAIFQRENPLNRRKICKDLAYTAYLETCIRVCACKNMLCFCVVGFAGFATEIPAFQKS